MCIDVIKHELFENLYETSRENIEPYPQESRFKQVQNVDERKKKKYERK